MLSTAKGSTVASTPYGQRKFELTQLYQTARNYLFGTGVNKNDIKAYVFASLYVDMLPKQYPGKQLFLALFKKNLDSDDIKLASNYQKSLRQKYHLGQSLNEHSLYQLFDFTHQEGVGDISEVSIDSWQVFKTELKESDPNFYHSMEKNLSNTNHHEQKLVYGRLYPLKDLLPQMVLSNQPVNISKEGYFYGYVSTPLVFSAPSYLSVSIVLDSQTQKIGLGIVKLQKPTPNNLADIVGSIKPQTNINAVNLSLKIADAYPKSDYFYEPKIIVTLLPNGQFYVKALTPNHYKLLVSYHNKQTTRDIYIKHGGYKSIKPIDLLKMDEAKKII